MNTTRHRRPGYTLVELLVVIAIIAMLSGLAIPAVLKVGGFMSKKSDSAARDLYGVLRAARISAVSYHNDTAVVYAVAAIPDNYTGAPSYVIDGYAMATRATKEEYNDLTTLGAPSYDSRFVNAREDQIFVLAQEPQARFRKMPRDTAVIGHLTAQEEQLLAAQGYVDVPPASIVDFQIGLPDAMDVSHLYDGLTSRGMSVVYLFDKRDEDGVLVPVDTTAGLTMDTSLTFLNAFPAHVFLPSGELAAPGSSLDPSLKERITIDVGPAPNAPLEDRFTKSPEEGGQPVMAAPVRIELYRSTGRVQIAS